MKLFFFFNISRILTIVLQTFVTQGFHISVQSLQSAFITPIPSFFIQLQFIMQWDIEARSKKECIREKQNNNFITV